MSYLHTTDIHNTKAAKEIVPYLINSFKPKSVLDVGCGIGTWLKVFEEYGLDDITGIDGDYVDEKLLYSNISKENFKPLNLNEGFNLNRKFDLLISLEVAEHLEEKSSDIFLNSLVKHSDLILFSAAIPDQWGQNHKNEQWQTYWIKKFQNLGFYCNDIRSVFWNNLQIEWWYKQNMFIFSKHKIDKIIEKPIYNIIHPEHFKQKIDYIKKINNIVLEKDNIISDYENKQKSIKYLLKILISEFLRRIKFKS